MENVESPPPSAVTLGEPRAVRGFPLARYSQREESGRSLKIESVQHPCLLLHAGARARYVLGDDGEVGSGSGVGGGRCLFIGGGGGPVHPLASWGFPRRGVRCCSTRFSRTLPSLTPIGKRGGEGGGNVGRGVSLNTRLPAELRQGACTDGRTERWGGYLGKNKSGETVIKFSKCSAEDL